MVQVCRHAAGAATEISDRPNTGGLHELGECGKQRPVQWLGREFSAHKLGVVDGDGVIGRPSSAQVGRFRHAEDRIRVISD